MGGPSGRPMLCFLLLAVLRQQPEKAADGQVFAAPAVCRRGFPGHWLTELQVPDPVGAQRLPSADLQKARSFGSFEHFPQSFPQSGCDGIAETC